MEESGCCVKVALNIRPILAGDGENAVAILRTELNKPQVRVDTNTCCGLPETAKPHAPSLTRLIRSYVPQVHLNNHSYAYDHVFGDGATTPNRLYSQCVSPLVDSLFMGYNATVFAYGKLHGFHCLRNFVCSYFCLFSSDYSCTSIVAAQILIIDNICWACGMLCLCLAERLIYNRYALQRVQYRDRGLIWHNGPPWQ
jgi:kinesin family protein 4/21/27